MKITEAEYNEQLRAEQERERLESEGYKVNVYPTSPTQYRSEVVKDHVVHGWGYGGTRRQAVESAVREAVAGGA